MGEFTKDNILSFSATARTIQELKQKGKTVALCHGSFDLVHAGHFKHFESAAKLADVLVVSLTADRFITPRKGDGRPIYNQELRAYMIACCEFVDYVTISDYQTGVETIHELKPNYYVKGPDYKEKQTPGITAERQAIAKEGGAVAYTDDIKLSTSDFISKIQAIPREKLLVFLDRDGTIIEEVDFLGKDNNWKQQIAYRRNVIDYLLQEAQHYELTAVVVSNQTGVARKFFTEDRVQEINKEIHAHLAKEGIHIKHWTYCPDADRTYAEKIGLDAFDPKYVKDKTNRKPSTAMAEECLNALSTTLADYDKTIMIGDRPEDKEFAKNLGITFIDANTL